MNNLLNVKKNIIIGLVIAFSLFVYSDVHARDIGGDSSYGEDSLGDITTLPGVKYHKSFGYLPEGESTEFNFTNKDGISLDSYYNYRKNIDFTDHINASGSKTVTMFDGTASFDGGISLGCDGLDLGLEAIAEFDAGDILEYLPEYIKTQLAKEALAQIYSLPLVSTVMDGLKSMQNFVAEFKQASCNMKDVQTRASELKNKRYKECIESKTGGTGKADSAVEAECSDPTGLEEYIKQSQNFMNKKLSLGGSLYNVLSKHVVKIDSNEHGDNYLDWSAGRALSWIVPNVRYGFNGNVPAEESAKARLDASMVYDQAITTVNNVSRGIYGDVMLSITKKGTLGDAATREVFLKLHNYKENLLRYGSNEIIYDTDNNDGETGNTRTYTKTEADAIIKSKFGAYSRVVFSNVRAKSGADEFKIGPAGGVMKHGVTDDDTDLEGMAREIFTYGNPGMCYFKVYETDKKVKYNWRLIYDSLDALDAAVESAPKIAGENGIENEVDAVIHRLAKCQTLKDIILPTYHEYMQADSKLPKSETSFATSYFYKISSFSAYSATDTMMKYYQNKLREAISDNEANLQKQCENAGGPSKLPARAVDDKTGVDGQPYKSCEQYVRQNRLEAENIEAIKQTIEKIQADLEKVEKEYYRYKEDFDDRKALYEMQKND